MKDHLAHKGHSKFKVGDRVQVIYGVEYFGMTGTVEHCNSCCRALRIQFDGVANNERLAKYRKAIKKIIEKPQ